MKYKVAKSKIPNADKGLFANKQIKQGERIGLAHKDGQPVGTLGNMHNHSDEPNMHSIKVGNKRYVYAKRDIKPGEELTTNYRMQPELEQPEDFMRKGGRTKGLVSMPKPSKKGLASKKYSRSLDATNFLFTRNPLFKKPKSRKNKVYHPNAKYYQKGGYIDLELDDAQIAQYVNGGYIVEEVNDPSIPALTKAAKGGTKKGCPEGQYWDGVKCTKLITLKNDKKYIDGVANWAMHVSDPNMVSGDYNDQIKERLYSGKWGLDPETGALVKLSAVQPKSVTTVDAKTKAAREKEKLAEKNYRAEEENKKAYEQSIIGAGFDPATFGKAKGINTITGEPIYASSKEEADRINQEAINQAAIEGHAAVVNNPVFKTAASFTPVGMAVGAVEGLARFIPDAYTLAQDPTLANVGQLGMDALQAAPLIGEPLARTLQSAKGLYNSTVKLANKTKKPLQNVAENIETVEDVIASPPGVPKPPLPNYEIILNRYNQLLNEGDSVLVARGAIADEFGIDAINIINNPPSAVTQPLYTGAIDLRRPSSNQLPNPPDELHIPTEVTGTSPRSTLNDNFEGMLSQVTQNLTDPNYQLTSSFDDFVNSFSNSRVYSPEELEQLSNNTRYRDYYNDVRSRQQASLNQELNNFTNDPSTYLRGEQNINTRPNVDYADKINRIAQDILYPENLRQLNTLNIPGKAKSAAKTLSKKLSDFKSNVSSAINKANVKLGEVIDKSKIETLKKPISAKDIDAEVNKNLAEGLGIKKGDIQIKVKTSPTGKTQVLIKPKEFFKKNKQLIEDTYGKGSFDEWINTVSDDWIDSGYLGLSSTSGEMVQPRKFTEILSGKKLEPSVNFGQGNINVPAPGLKRSGDFPFANWEGSFRENLLENLGVSGELTQAYNKALKGKGYGAYSGGTGHLAPGAKRYIRELLNNRVEVINSNKAEDLYRLLNDESTRNAVNNALKNKNEPLPASVYQAIQPLIFKYKRKGGATDSYIELEIPEEEIQKYIDQGYIVEALD